MSKEQSTINDKAISFANDCGTTYGAVAYRLNLDGIRLTSVQWITYAEMLHGYHVFWGTIEDFVSKGYSKDYVRAFSAVLQQSFLFAVFPNSTSHSIQCST